jgi:predicted CoA-binding protein
MSDTAPRFDHGFPEQPADHTVVVLGASPKPARYANMAQRQLVQLGYRVIPVHPKIAQIEGLRVTPNLRAIAEPVHTITLYVGPERSRPLIDDILRLNPRRVIFNPGSESAELERRLREHHIPHVHGCTLVMLRTNQF